jgi:hypothetical protein
MTRAFTAFTSIWPDKKEHTAMRSWYFLIHSTGMYKIGTIEKRPIINLISNWQNDQEIMSFKQLAQTAFSIAEVEIWVPCVDNF